MTKGCVSFLEARRKTKCVRCGRVSTWLDFPVVWSGYVLDEPRFYGRCRTCLKELINE